MNLGRYTFQIFALLIVCSGLVTAQVLASDAKHFDKEGLTFDYSAGWSIADTSNSDAQQLQLSRPDADLQMTVFVHRGRISSEKMADAHKAIIDPYIEGVAKQFVSMGARVERSSDSTDIGGVRCDGIKLKAIVTGDSATSQIYWGLIGQRVVVLTFFGPDNDRKKFASTWDTVRNSLKIAETKPAPKRFQAPK